MGAGEPVTLAVYDALGRRVRTVLEAADLAAGAHAETVDVSGLAAGVYVVHLWQGDRRSVRRVSVAR